MQPSLEETIYLDFVTSSSTGAAADADSTPTAEVFEDATDTAVITPTVTKRTGKTGNYRVPVACTAANGFEAGKTYNVIASATIGGVAAKARVGVFQVRARDTDDLSTYAGGDTAGVTTLLTRLGATLTITGGGVTVAAYASGQAPLQPTTAGRTLDVSATGEAGVDWGNVGSPTTAVALSGTTVGTTTAVTNGVTLAANQDVRNVLGTLTTTERTAIANEVEAQIIDETDSEKVLTAITDKIAAVNPSLGGLTLAAIAAAVRDVSNAAPTAGGLGAVLNAVRAKTDNLPADPAGLAGLASAHGAGSWATATGFSTHTAADVWAVGTRTLTSLSGLTVDAVTTLTNDPGGVTTLLSRLSALRAGYLDNLSGGAVALAGSAPSWYSAPLTAAGVRSAVGMAAANLDTQLAALDADVMTRLAGAGYTAPDNAGVATAAAVAAKIDTALVLNAGAYRYTAAALALAPAGGGIVSANVVQINSVDVTGDGSATPWGPA